LEEELREAATTLDITERVAFAGSVADVVPHLQWADVLILTSRSEGLPGAILEASAAAVPTVAVDVGGVGEAVLDGVSGYVTKRSADELAAALTGLDSDRQRLREMGEAARRHVFSEFLLDDIIDRYAELLASLKQ
jgi:glycosyltransferase involved in cell wall biosynthesis